MSSKEYWAEREAKQLKHYIADEAEYDKQIKRIYEDMLDSIQREIDGFYGRYADKEGISIAMAKKRASKLDIEAYERKAKKYVADRDFSEEANEEMRLYNATMKINRLEMLKANIGLELISGHDELKSFMEEILQGRTEEELKRQAGILGDTIQNNAQMAHAIPNASFHNANFSDRIWMYQDILKAELHKLLKTGLIQGKNPRVLARELRKKVDANRYNTERLMRTELARVQTEAQKQSFERNGFEEYTFLANHNCCDICSGLNNKSKPFKVKDMMPGENAPPMHPHCRCSTAAYMDRKDYEEWIDYLLKGGTTEEWKKFKNTGKSVDKSGKSGIIKVRAVSGALNPNDKKAQRHADQYYESVRHMKNDVNRIAKNTGWRSNAIEQIKNYVFVSEHDLSGGRGRFAPSYDMAQSWQRLIDGKHIKEQDLVLLKHEYLEMKLVEKGMTQDEAHIKASKKHNFAKYLE